MVMTVEVGVNSYVTMEEAEEYVTSFYPLSDPYRDAWCKLSETERAARLILAAQTLDQLRYRGRKAAANQTMSFPRLIYSEYLRQWMVQEGVPWEVKVAQMEETLQLSAGIPDHVSKQRQGVKAYTIGKLSETFGGSGGTIDYQTAAGSLTSQRARMFIAGFLVGEAVIV